MGWEVIDTGVASAARNMELDAALLASLPTRKDPIVHFYDWEGLCATHGYFVKPEDFLNRESVALHNVQLARRPTGGGIVFHIWDFAFSVLIPSSCPLFSKNTLENYALVNNAVLRAVKQFLKGNYVLTPSDSISMDSSCKSFCMARPTKYDVMLGDRKVAGAAQRQKSYGFLHQGTISLMKPSKLLNALLLPRTLVWEAMQAYTAHLLDVDATENELKEVRCEMRLLLEQSLTKDT